MLWSLEIEFHAGRPRRAAPTVRSIASRYTLNAQSGKLLSNKNATKTDPASSHFQYIHDRSVVRPPQIQERPAPGNNRRQLGYRFFEYVFQVPANRIGSNYFTVTQLKIIQECITLIVFTVFAFLIFREPLRWNNLVSYILLIGAVAFAFWPH